MAVGYLAIEKLSSTPATGTDLKVSWMNAAKVQMELLLEEKGVVAARSDCIHLFNENAAEASSKVIVTCTEQTQCPSVQTSDDCHTWYSLLLVCPPILCRLRAEDLVCACGSEFEPYLRAAILHSRSDVRGDILNSDLQRNFILLKARKPGCIIFGEGGGGVWSFSSLHSLCLMFHSFRPQTNDFLFR